MVVERTSKFDINLTGNATMYPVMAYTRCTVQAVLSSGTWATAVIVVQVSNDGVNYSAMPEPVMLPTGGGITGIIDVSGYAYVRIYVDTTEGAAGEVALAVRFS